MKKMMVFAVVLFAFAGMLFANGAQEESVLFEDRFQDMSWDEIVAEADGQSVFFYMWGGADHINNWVNGYLKDTLKEKYNVTLEMVPVDGAPVYVNKVLGEKQAGKNTKGAVDVMWINGENFKTMMQGELLFGPYSDKLPNIKYCSPDILGYDFGYPINGYESPYGAAQCVMEYDTEYVSTPPKSIGELFDWAKANPGKFTYAAPPDFNGSAFVRHVFYYVAGGYDKMMGPFDEAVYNEIAPKVWDLLNDVEPYLWRKGETYPESRTKMTELLGNGEVYFNNNYGPDGATNAIRNGIYPDSVKTFVFDSGTIGNINFVAIAYNSGNKAASMVMANELLDPETQYNAASPEGMSWFTPLDLTTIPADVKAKFDAIPISASRITTEELNTHKLPELQSDWLMRIEEDWQEFVLRK